MIFSKRGNFGQLKINTVQDYIIEKESVEYLSGTPWDFLDIEEEGPPQKISISFFAKIHVTPLK